MKVLFDSRVLREALRVHDFAPLSVALEIAEISPLHRAFADVVDGRYDIAELPIVAVLQAVDAGRPLALLPLTLLGRFQHHTLVTADPSGRVTAAGLAGKRVGVRSWGQTTAVWVCGFLSADYGVNADEIHWVVYSDAPVPGTTDPEYVTRAAVGADLGEDLLSGAVDAAIMGSDLPADERIRTVLPSPARAAAQWFGRTGATPINHVTVVRDEVLREHPDVIAKVCTVIAEMMPRTPRISSTPDFHPMGFDALAPALDLAGQYAYEQGLISWPISASELRERTEALMGAALGQIQAAPQHAAKAMPS